MQRDGLAERAKVMGARLAAGLRGLQQRFDCIGDVRGRGLLLGLEFRASGGRDAAAISDAVTDVALELGLSANIVRAGASRRRDADRAAADGERGGGGSGGGAAGGGDWALYKRNCMKRMGRTRFMRGEQ